MHQQFPKMDRRLVCCRRSSQDGPLRMPQSPSGQCQASWRTGRRTGVSTSGRRRGAQGRRWHHSISIRAFISPRFWLAQIGILATAPARLVRWVMRRAIGICLARIASITCSKCTWTASGFRSNAFWAAAQHGAPAPVRDGDDAPRRGPVPLRPRRLPLGRRGLLARRRAGRRLGPPAQPADAALQQALAAIDRILLKFTSR